MFVERICAIILLSAFFAQGHENREPMVAFVCNRPAMRLTDDGWMKDDSTGCLANPDDILSYCQKVFPSLDIRNVIETGEKVTIDNWCQFGQTSCDEQFGVFPFRCLPSGPFQTDALLVPEHCAFHHLHEPHLCVAVDRWKAKSTEACARKGLRRGSFGMLRPCGVGRFSGIEFVCCPTNQSAIIENESDKRFAAFAGDNSVSNNMSKAATKDKKERENYTKARKTKEYVKLKKEKDLSSARKSRDYDEAKRNMYKYHLEKMSKMVKDWTSQRKQVENLKAVDLSASEKLSKEVTSRFQKMYEAAEAEDKLERRQLQQLNQLRIQTKLDERMQMSFDDFVAVTSDRNARASVVVKPLRRLIRSLHRDRVHLFNALKRLWETNPKDADESRRQMVPRLAAVDKQLDDALRIIVQMKHKDEIRKLIEEDLGNYHLIDSSILALLQNSATTTSTAATTAAETTAAADVDLEYPTAPTIDYDDYDDDSDDDDAGENGDYDEELKYVTEKVKQINSAEYDDDDDVDDEDYDDDDDEDKEEMKVSTEISKAAVKDLTEKQPLVSVASTQFVPVLVEDRPFPGLSEDINGDFLDDYMHLKRNVHSDGFGSNEFQVKQSPVVKSSTKSPGGISSAIPLGIAVSGITVFVVIVIGFVTMRRQVRRRHLSIANVPDASPSGVSSEQRHVAGLQMNGYENPTYKYFEINSK